MPCMTQPYPHPQYRPPRPPRRRMARQSKIALIIAGAVVAAGGILSVVDPEDGTAGTTPTAKIPAYTVTDQDSSGNKRDVIVEVDSTKDLRGVFDDVAKGLTEEAGYYIMINCSTGGTKSVDNRLANGQVAIGRMGAATTGLEAGATEFSTNAGRTCPDD